MDVYICKICGRTIRTDKEPKYCYADGISNYEKITEHEVEMIGAYFETESEYEFPGDVKYDPYTREEIPPAGDTTLTAYQRQLLKEKNK